MMPSVYPGCAKPKPHKFWIICPSANFPNGVTLCYKKKDAMLFDTTSFQWSKTIIDQPGIELSSYTNATGDLILSASLYLPKGMVFFKTDVDCLHLFYEVKINLQSLFEATKERIISVTEHYASKLFQRRDTHCFKQGRNIVFGISKLFIQTGVIKKEKV